jgi:acyl dehydratase
MAGGALDGGASRPVSLLTTEGKESRFVIIINGIDDLLADGVEREAVSEWHTISQDGTNRFAEVTGDKNPLHVDVEFARQSYGSTIVHGLHLLAMARCCSPRS